MNTLRKIGLVIAATLLPLSLFSFGFTLSTYQTFSTSDHIKSALEKSNIYDTVIGDVLDHAQNEEGRGQGDFNIPVDRPEVKQIIEQAAPAGFLQSQTEGFLDGIYAWARGDTKDLQLEINLIEAKAKLADGLAQYAANRAATLPACTATDLSLMQQQGDFNALEAPCLPPGTDVNAAAEKVRQEVNGGEFLKDPLITEQDIKNDQGQSLQEQLKDIPGIFDKLVRGMWISGSLVVLFSAAIILLSKPWRKGLKRLGITFVSVGGTITVLALIANVAISALAGIIAKEGDLQKSLADVITILAGDFRNWWLGFGLTVLLLGIAMLISLRFIKAGKEPEESSVSKPEKPAGPNKPATKPGAQKNPHITKTV